VPPARLRRTRALAHARNACMASIRLTRARTAARTARSASQGRSARGAVAPVPVFVRRARQANSRLTKAHRGTPSATIVPKARPRQTAQRPALTASTASSKPRRARSAAKPAKRVPPARIALAARQPAPARAPTASRARLRRPATSTIPHALHATQASLATLVPVRLRRRTARRVLLVGTRAQPGQPRVPRAELAQLAATVLAAVVRARANARCAVSARSRLAWALGTRSVRPALPAPTRLVQERAAAMPARLVLRACGARAVATALLGRARSAQPVSSRPTMAKSGMPRAATVHQASSPVLKVSPSASTAPPARTNPAAAQRHAGTARNAMPARSALAAARPFPAPARSAQLGSTRPTRAKAGMLYAQRAPTAHTKTSKARPRARCAAHAQRVISATAVPLPALARALRALQARSRALLLSGTRSAASATRARLAELMASPFALTVPQDSTKTAKASRRASRVPHAREDLSVLAARSIPPALVRAAQTAAGSWGL